MFPLPTLHFCSSILAGKWGEKVKGFSVHITHMLRLQKYIFVQEGKNRTLMQSGNHVAVRNVIIQFFGRPHLYVFKLVTKKAGKMPRILPNGYQNHCYLCLIYSPGTSFSALIPMSTEILKWAKKCAFYKRILIRFLSLSEVVKRYPIHPSSHFRNLSINRCSN